MTLREKLKRFGGKDIYGTTIGGRVSYDIDEVGNPVVEYGFARHTQTEFPKNRDCLAKRMMKNCTIF